MRWKKIRREKTRIEKDWRLADSLNQIEKLMTIRTQVFSPPPYTEGELATLLYTEEQRNALPVVAAMDPEHMLNRERYATLAIKLIPEGSWLHVRLDFPEPMFVTRYDRCNDSWFEPPVQAQLREWAVKRKKYYTEQCMTKHVAETLFNRAGTYAQIVKLWPGLRTFLQQEMRQKVETQKTTRISEELRNDWDEILKSNSISCEIMEHWLTEALLVEHNDYQMIQAY